MKKIPQKNYIILSLVFIITIALTFYAKSWYNTSKQYYAQNSVMTKAVREIKSEEIANYTLENQKFILYTSSGHNTDLKNFENEFKSLIQKLDLQDDVLYLNIDNTSQENVSDLLKSLTTNEKIKNQITSTITSDIYLFNNSKVVAVLKNANKYSPKRLETLIKKWGVNNA